MAYRWAYDDNGKPLQPEMMTDAEREEHADIVASAIEDGGPSPGADYLIWLRGALEVDSNNEILQRLLGDRNADEYLTEHWNAQRAKFGLS